jgi:hypothetical protein
VWPSSGAQLYRVRGCDAASTERRRTFYCLRLMLRLSGPALEERVWSGLGSGAKRSEGHGTRSTRGVEAAAGDAERYVWGGGQVECADTPETTLEECVVSRPLVANCDSWQAEETRVLRGATLLARAYAGVCECATSGQLAERRVWGLTRSVTRTLNAYCRKLAAEGASTLPDLISWLMCVELLPTSRTHPLLALPKKDTNCTALSDASNNWQHARSFSTHGHLSAAKRTLVHVSRSESV